MTTTPARESWIEIVVRTPPLLSDPLANFLDELGTRGVFEEESIQGPFNDFPEDPPKTVTIKAYLPDTGEVAKKLSSLETYTASLKELFPELEAPSYSTSTISDPDWAERWKKYFKPLRISKNIVIKPTWERYRSEGGEIVIDIDPGMAFGTGQHASTRLSVNAIEDIILKQTPPEGWNVLDIGTGTGILAMCCAMLGADLVTAIDLDPLAVEIAAVNIAINDLHDRIRLVNRDASDMEGTFNLIVANLTAPALMNLRDRLVTMMAPGGYLVASGIIDTYGSRLEQIFEDDGVTVTDRRDEKEWLCLTFKKRDP
ncbi:MAG: 50S ribosomal protein L11 methyltransferase [Syntrophales bacterium]|jgi:ribosomal protein L11 methyltransferase|nr:50S ribosomal protein L11 methyltransferase [Syntrophales bacterium]MCK9527297.1 50S ribosomal protein L11 methyltransferase [Syntrophales bacterium]MDX9921233.1 50S ribosomal protein L11 methyltransferase [Syntrophales bacterium]